MKEPKDKVTELVSKFYEHGCYENAIECAKIAVDEIMKALDDDLGDMAKIYSEQYWQQVRLELDKL